MGGDSGVGSNSRHKIRSSTSANTSIPRVSCVCRAESTAAE
jgi:hypothetical protein